MAPCDLTRGDAVDGCPVVRRNQAKGVIRYSLDEGRAEEGSSLLLHGHPCNIVNQRLLRLLVCLETCSLLRIFIGTLQQLLGGWLGCRVSGEILPIIHAV